MSRLFVAATKAASNMSKFDDKIGTMTKAGDTFTVSHIADANEN